MDKVELQWSGKNCILKVQFTFPIPHPPFIRPIRTKLQRTMNDAVWFIKTDCAVFMVELNARVKVERDCTAWLAFEVHRTRSQMEWLSGWWKFYTSLFERLTGSSKRWQNIRQLLHEGICVLPGVQGAGPADVARRCGRADVLVVGVLRWEGQPRRSMVLSGLILVREY